VFNKIDKDHSNFIDKESEFVELIKMAGGDVTKSAEFVKACDFDGDGKIGL
jgi:hypothetical protein